MTKTTASNSSQRESPVDGGGGSSVDPTALEPVIGLEVHVQLDTQTKLFCGCTTRFGNPPNDNVCPLCSGQPGVLPVLNNKAVEYAVRLGLALGCTIRRRSRFARKNYFYPDLPKGYQISQYDEPICEHGAIELSIDGAYRRVGITRIHIEEDAGKLIHVAGGSQSMVDLNRAGVPLVEIVSEPELSSPQQAAEYMRSMRAIVRALGISDGNLEQGSLRCDANVSLRPRGSDGLGTKTEIKNINSFRFVQRALDYEIHRQRELLGRGERVVQQTRLFDADRGTTHPMRDKEQAHDYRYFPEPDLPPVVLEEHWISAVGASIPELPLARRARFVDQLSLTEQDAAELTRELQLADYFEAVVNAGVPAKRAANWVRSELLSRVADARDVAKASVSPEATAELLLLVEEGKLSTKLAKALWPKMWESGESARQIAEREDLFQQSDSGAIEAQVRAVIEANPAQVAQYRAGKTKVKGFFVGQIMKATKGKANPQLVNDLLDTLLGAETG